jgi:hypothetical protein
MRARQQQPAYQHEGCILLPDIALRRLQNPYSGRRKLLGAACSARRAGATTASAGRSAGHAALYQACAPELVSPPRGSNDLCESPCSGAPREASTFGAGAYCAGGPLAGLTYATNQRR